MVFTDLESLTILHVHIYSHVQKVLFSLVLTHFFVIQQLTKLWITTVPL